MSTQPQSEIECFENRNSQVDYLVEFECPEFTCVCPMTGQPDFAVIKVAYIPNRKCVELKSLKLYLWGFRERGIFHEDVVNEIGAHLHSVLSPRYLHLTGDFRIRGGINTRVGLSWGKAPAGWSSLNP